MKKLLLILVILLISCATPKKCCAQEFFKYSTFYTSITTNTPFTEREDYIA